MPDSPNPAPTPEERRLAIDERRLAIEERRIALEESFSKKWGNYVLPVMATICTAIITATVTWNSNYISSLQKQTENNRAAVDLYFKLFPKKETKLPSGAQSLISDIEFDMLEKITTESDLRGALSKIREFMATSKWEEASIKLNSDDSTKTPDAAQRDLANALAGVRDITQAPINGDYKPADFLAYPQAPIGADDAAVSRMLKALGDLGFKVRGVQRMKPGISPSQNEVRYYLPEHRPLAEQTAKDLGNSFGQPFVARPVNIGKTLPNGIMEFWLAEKK